MFRRKKISWKRSAGISGAKAKISRKIGTPTTRSGRQRKTGKATGCCIPFAFILFGFIGAIAGLSQLISGVLNS